MSLLVLFACPMPGEDESIFDPVGVWRYSEPTGTIEIQIGFNGTGWMHVSYNDGRAPVTSAISWTADAHWKNHKARLQIGRLVGTVHNLSNPTFTVIINGRKATFYKVD